MRSGRNLLAVAAGFAAMGGGAPQALAQEAAPTDDTLVVDMITVTAPAVPADEANAIGIGPADLERRDPRTLKQVFAGEASVSVGGAQPASQKLYVNGIEETNLAVTVDGARQNNKVFHHATTNLIDPALLRAVRVDPGVAPADAGPGALAGSVAYETVDAADLLAPGRAFGGFGTASYGTNGDLLTGGIAVYGRARGFDGLAWLRGATGDDFEDGDGRTVPGTEPRLRSGIVKGGWQSEGGHRVELGYEQVTDDGNRPFRANIGGIDGLPNPEIRRYDLTSRNLVLDYEALEARGPFQPSAMIGWSENVTDVPDPYGSEGRGRSLTGRIGNRFALGGAGSVDAGIDFYRDESSYADPATPEIRERADNLGLFAQARLNPFAPLELSFGARSDWQTFEGIDGSETDTSGLSGNVSASYAVGGGVTLRAGYSDVFGGIALGEPYVFNPAWTYDDLEPARARNYTLGFDVARDGFTLGAGVFRSEIDNARDSHYSLGAWLPFDFRSEGYRLAAGYAWDDGFVRATYVDAEVTSDGEPVDSDTLTYFGAPVGRVFGLEAEQRIDRFGIAIGGTMEATGDNDDLVDQGLDVIDGYTVVNLYAEYRPSVADNLTLRLEANNLFDETYAERTTYGQEFAGVRPLNEPGRSIVLTARLDF